MSLPIENIKNLSACLSIWDNIYIGEGVYRYIIKVGLYVYN